MEVRRREQNTAAAIGGYAAMIQLDYPSGAVKNPDDPSLTNDLLEILTASLPEVVYTHNPADKHDTHIGVTLAALRAMRAMPREQRPKQVIGCEVWRNLDWLPDEAKVLMDVSGRDNLAAALNGVFDSHSTDAATQLVFGIDLTPLVADESLDIADYVCGFIEQFKADVRHKLSKA